MAHQPVIGVIRHRFGAQRLHQRIEHVCRAAFEGCVGLAVVAHAIHDFGAFAPGLHHVCHSVRIILQVGVHRDGRVRLRVQGVHQSGEQRVLMPLVVRQLQTVEQLGILIVQRADYIPRAVL